MLESLTLGNIMTTVLKTCQMHEHQMHEKPIILYHGQEKKSPSFECCIGKYPGTSTLFIKTSNVT